MARVIDEHILRGNSATLKCLIPSFVADFVEVISWESEGEESYTYSEASKYIGNFCFGVFL